MKEIIFSIMLVILLLAVFHSSVFQKEDFRQKRARILNELSLSIEEAIVQGKYKCCIDPPCTMCYLGNWIWKDGTCDCDSMIVNGDWDSVCPQCIKGIKEGRCISQIKDTECIVPGSDVK